MPLLIRRPLAKQWKKTQGFLITLRQVLIHESFGGVIHPSFNGILSPKSQQKQKN
jgi:hypothetical protein